MTSSTAQIAAPLNVRQRMADKESSRRADEQAIRDGSKTAEQVKGETEAFAFPEGEARVNLRSARSLS